MNGVSGEYASVFCLVHVHMCVGTGSASTCMIYYGKGRNIYSLDQNYVQRCEALTTVWQQELQVINQVTEDASVIRVFWVTNLQDHTHVGLCHAWANYFLFN